MLEKNVIMASSRVRRLLKKITYISIYIYRNLTQRDPLLTVGLALMKLCGRD